MPLLFLPDELHAELCHHHKRPRSLQVTLLSSLMSDGGRHEWDPRHTPEGFNKQKSGRLRIATSGAKKPLVKVSALTGEEQRNEYDMQGGLNPEP